MSHRLLIYHSGSKVYKEILSKKLPRLEIKASVHPEEAYDFIEEADIIFSWQISDELLKRTKRLRWFFSMAAGNEDLKKGYWF